MRWWASCEVLGQGLLILVLLDTVIAHVRLTYPPGRFIDLDFLDNARTKGPCGVPTNTDKDKITLLRPGMSFNITWHLSYPHRGGYQLQILEGSDVRHWLTPQSQYLGSQDVTTQSHMVTLPADFTCELCTIRLLRQASEWGPVYRFWSCAEVSIQAENQIDCSGYPVENGKCICPRLYSGKYCQYKDDCVDNSDCSSHGECVDIEATSYPKKQCFCDMGWFGRKCEKESTVKDMDFTPSDYTKKRLSDGYVMYHRVLLESDEVEIILEANCNTWMAVGWRPTGYGPRCRAFPSVAAKSESEQTEPPSSPEVETEPNSTKEPNTEGETNAEGETEPKPKNEPNAEGQGNAEGETEPEYKNEPSAQGEGKAEGETEPEYKNGPTVEGEGKVREATEPEPKNKPSGKGEGKAEEEPEPIAEGEGKAEEDTEPNPEDESSKDEEVKVLEDTESEPENEPSADVEGEAGEEAEHTEEGKGRAEGDPESEPKNEPSAEREGKAGEDPELNVEGEGKAEEDTEPNPKDESGKDEEGKVLEDTEPEPNNEPSADVEGEAGEEAEHTEEGEGRAEEETEPEPTNEPSAEGEVEAEAGPSAEDEPEPEGENSGGDGEFHAMDCTDMVIGAARGSRSRIMDFYTRDRSTPREDEVYGGTQSLTAAVGMEMGGTTFIRFRRKLKSSERADYTISEKPMHLIYALGQQQGAYIHRPDSGYELGLASDTNFYHIDELKYHGHGNQRGSATIQFVEKKKPDMSPVDVCVSEYRMPRGCPDEECAYRARWTFNEQADTVSFEIVAKQEQNTWTGIGFSEGRTMENVDTVLGWIDDNGNGHVFESYIDRRYSRPVEDNQKDLTLSSFTYNGGLFTLKFTRKRNTGDTRDHQFSDGQCYYAFFPTYGGRVINGQSLSKHFSTPSIREKQVCIRKCEATEKKVVASLRLHTDWKKEFSDLESREAKAFIDTWLPELIDKMVAKVPTINDVTVRDLRQGSVIADLDITYTTTGSEDDVSSTNYAIRQVMMDEVSDMNLGGHSVDPSYVFIVDEIDFVPGNGDKEPAGEKPEPGTDSKESSEEEPKQDSKESDEGEYKPAEEKALRQLGVIEIIIIVIICVLVLMALIVMMIKCIDAARNGEELCGISFGSRQQHYNMEKKKGVSNNARM